MNRAKLVSTAKYSGTSVAVGTALTSIIIFSFPALKEVQEAIGALVIFGVNVLLVMSGLLSDSE